MHVYYHCHHTKQIFRCLEPVTTESMSSSIRKRELTQCDDTVSTNDSSDTRKDNSNIVNMKNLKDLKPKFIYNAILVTILVFYGLVGASVFRKLEMATIDRDSVDSSNPALTKERFIHELWNSNKKQHDFNEWSARVTEKLSLYEKTLQSSQPTDSGTQWSWSNSWLFACTILTTVGKFVHLSVLG